MGRYRNIEIDPILHSIFKQYCEENGYVMKYRVAHLIKKDIGEEKYEELYQAIQKKGG
jgi:hypothetical protein